MNKNILLIPIAFIFVILSCNTARDEQGVIKSNLFDSLALTPPMGWNSWNSFGFRLNENQLLNVVDYIADSLKSYGWEYVVIDAGWYYPESVNANMGKNPNLPYHLDAYGRLIPDEEKFPSSKNGNGFKEVANYIHDKGLKFGIHIMRGIPRRAYEFNLPVKDTETTAGNISNISDTCEWNGLNYGLIEQHPSSYMYYKSIVDLYTEWGVDFVKIDDISRPYHKNEVDMFSEVVKESQRPFIISLSPGPSPVSEVDHLRKNAHMWRISNDFWDNWNDLKRSFTYTRQWYAYIENNHWPDSDMLPLGKLRLNGGDDWIASKLNANPEDIVNEYTRFTKEEQYTVMNLWCISKSPLIMGGHLPDNDEFSSHLITNEDIIELNQYSSHNREFSYEDSISVWTARLDKKNYKYLAVFNISEKNKRVILNANNTGIQLDNEIMNIWTKEKTNVTGEFEIVLNPHASVLYRINDRDNIK